MKRKACILVASILISVGCGEERDAACPDNPSVVDEPALAGTWFGTCLNYAGSATSGELTLSGVNNALSGTLATSTCLTGTMLATGFGWDGVTGKLRGQFDPDTSTGFMTIVGEFDDGAVVFDIGTTATITAHRQQ